MSIAAMVDAKLVREHTQTTATPAGVPTNIVNQLTRWIPTETITLYVALLAVFGPLNATADNLCKLSFTSRWVAVAAFAVVSTLLALGLTYGKARALNKRFTWPWFEMATSPVAFAAWALALPDTPLQSICGYNSAIGAFIVLVTTVSLAVLASILGKSPNYDQVLTK